MKKKFKSKNPKVLYGGSVNPKNITILKKIKGIKINFIKINGYKKNGHSYSWFMYRAQWFKERKPVILFHTDIHFDPIFFDKIILVLPCINLFACMIFDPKTWPIIWWPRHTPSIGILLYNDLTIFIQFPAWLGFPGPGDITILSYFFLIIY